jgi:peptidoglycan/LPS O-acetylase OafA/YrhL
VTDSEASLMTDARPESTPELTPKSTPTRLPFLDGVRASAALYVLVHHAYCMAYPIRYGIRPTGWTRHLLGWALWGHYGVTVFIALAGFSLTLGVAGKGGELPGGTVGYLKRRAWRIIPPYWAAIVLTILLISTVIGRAHGTHWDQSVPTQHKGWIADILLAQDAVPALNVAYPFWSVAVEFHIYLLLPIMLFAWRRYGRWEAGVGVGLALGAIGVLLGRVLFPWPFDRFIFEYYLVFALAAGACLVAVHRPSWSTTVPWRTLGWSCIALVVLMGYLFTFWELTAHSWELDLVLGVGICSLLVSLSQGTSPTLHRVLSWTHLRRVAGYSYSIYLVHAPLLAVAWLGINPMHLSRGAQLAVGWLVVVPLVVVAAWLFSQVFEQPFVRRQARQARVQRAVDESVVQQ